MEPEIDPTFEILLETDEFIAVNKSGNCPVHEGGLYKENCLVRILEKKFGHRYFPVYRLDRETSGIVVFAKKSEFVKKIFDSISEKEYVAVCRGNLSEKQTIDLPIGETKGEHIDWKKCISDDGKKSKTEIMPIQFSDGFSIVKAIPKTGRAAPDKGASSSDRPPNIK
jgi:23S rRNA pseudouridine955/2504/2580 synthase/23S rRNA pseudouridine1911/1915/1917 synthase